MIVFLVDKMRLRFFFLRVEDPGILRVFTGESDLNADPQPLSNRVEIRVLEPDPVRN